MAVCLEDDGWVVLARNWRGGGAELDVVVSREGMLRFVEVKARDMRDPTGADAVGHHKRARLRRGALAWLQQHGEPERECAFMVAVVTPIGTEFTVEWFDDAF